MRIVEFGSGISTIVIASLIRSYGGRLISVEHDAAYAARQRDAIKQQGLSEFVSVQVSPLGKTVHLPFRHRWYDVPNIDEWSEVDLVVVDGPPSDYGAEIRFPGGDLMIPKLVPGGSIIFDDADRPGERRIKTALIEKYPELIVSEPPTIRGCLVLTKPQ